MNTKNFFYILYYVCSSTKAFSALAKNGYIKAFWHLIILTLICSIGFALGNMTNLKRDISEACSILTQEFGGISVEQEGIYPKIGRAREHHVEYQSFRIDYLPQHTDLANFNLNLDLYSSGIVWTPNSATGWLRISNSEVIIYPALTTLSDTNFFSIYSTNYLTNYLVQTPKLKGTEDLALKLCIQGYIPVVGAFVLKPIDAFGVLVPSLVKWSSAIVMLRFFATAIFNTLFYGLIFAFIYRITTRSNYTFKNFFIIAIYASFPAIIIGTLLSLAQTQWLDYSTIFIIAFVIYLFLILNNLKNNMKGISE